MKIEIVREPRLTGSPVMRLCPEAWVEFYKLNTIDDYQIPFHGADLVIAAYGPRQEPIGFISFNHHYNDAGLWICCSYVKPEHRKQGVFRKLWNELRAYCEEHNMTRIVGLTHSNNERMKSAYRSTGRVKTGEMWTYDLPRATTKPT